MNRGQCRGVGVKEQSGGKTARVRLRRWRDAKRNEDMGDWKTASVRAKALRRAACRTQIKVELGFVVAWRNNQKYNLLPLRGKHETKQQSWDVTPRKPPMICCFFSVTTVISCWQDMSYIQCLCSIGFKCFFSGRRFQFNAILIRCHPIYGLLWIHTAKSHNSAVSLMRTMGRYQCLSTALEDKLTINPNTDYQKLFSSKKWKAFNMKGLLCCCFVHLLFIFYSVTFNLCNDLLVWKTQLGE